MPIPAALVEKLVKSSTKASRVPLRLRDLATAHVVAQALLAARPAEDERLTA